MNCDIKRAKAILTEKISDFGNYVHSRRRNPNKASYNGLEKGLVYDLKTVSRTNIFSNHKNQRVMTYVKFNSRPLNKTLPHIMDELINEIPVLFNESVNSFLKETTVPVNITETPAAYSIEVVAPGFEKKDFKISLENNLLTISAETENELQKDIKNSEEKQIRQEYKFRNFKRSFTIDDKIDATTIDASYVNGVLVLNLPKKVEVKPAAKNIKIQ